LVEARNSVLVIERWMDDICESLRGPAVLGGLVAHYESKPPIVSAIEERQDVDEVRRLLDAGTDPNEYIQVFPRDGRSSFSTTPLVSAAAVGASDIVRLLLARGAHPESQSFDYTPLGIMVAQGSCDGEVVRLLVEAGANPNQREREVQQNILYTVAGSGDLETVRFLLARGIELEAAQLEAAADSGNADVFEAILRCPAERFEPGLAPDETSEDVAQDIPRFQSRQDAPDRFEALLPPEALAPLWRLLLARLIKYRDRYEDVVARVRSVSARALVVGGAAAPSQAQLPPLHVLCYPAEGEQPRVDDLRDGQLAKVLIDAGHSVDEPSPFDRSTALLRAAGNGRRLLVEVLLAHGADPKALDLLGRSAAAWADRSKSLELTELLVAAGAERQVWREPAPAAPAALSKPVGQGGKQGLEIEVWIGLVILAISAGLILFFWLLIRFGS
jgi:ankyrin repeat protein